MSNKTPKNLDAKTASAPKKSRHPGLWVAGVLAIVMLATIGWLIFRPANNFGSLKLVYEVVDTPASRERGLSGRSSLGQGDAMLFAFDQTAKHCFWMKDMNFPLDMIWTDEQGRVVHIEQNVKPETYPNSFCPDQPARYVVEVNAGVADKAGVEEGDSLQF